MQIAYFDCSSGVSGDMILGALLDAGLDFAYLKKELAKLNLPGCRVVKRKVKRAGFAATKFDVLLSHKHGRHRRRSLKEIKDIINKSRLNSAVKSLSLKIFENLADAEWRAHNADRQKIYFHEIGNMDSLIDVVGAAVAIDCLKIDKIYSSAINTGSGTIKTAHGVLPVPAPATAILLKGIPAYSEGENYELATPTGVAILKIVCDEFGRMPLMEIKNIGIAAGNFDIKNRANVLRVFLGDTARVGEYDKDTAVVVETNIDDMNLIGTEQILERIFKAGALDVYFVPIYMKKTRLGIKLSVITEKKCLNAVLMAIFQETSTFGVRTYEVTRYKLDRFIKSVKGRFGTGRVKIGTLGGKIMNISPEYQDCKILSTRKNVPFHIVYDELKARAGDPSTAPVRPLRGGFASLRSRSLGTKFSVR